MFRLSVKVLPRNVVASRLFSAASPAVSNIKDEEIPNPRAKGLTRDDRTTIYMYRDAARAVMQEKYRKICQVGAGSLSEKEIQAELDEITQLANAMTEKLNVTHPLADLINYALTDNLVINDALFKRFQQSNEFKELTSDTENMRPHLFTPGVFILVKELKTKEFESEAARVQHIASFLNEYLDYTGQIRPIVNLIRYLTFEENPKLLAQLIKASNNSRKVASLLVEGLLYSGKMDRLKELMEASLKTEADLRIFAHRVTAVIIRKLKSLRMDQPSSSQELQTIAQVIAIGLKSSDADSTGSQALATIFCSSAVSDDILKKIVDYLMEDSNVLVAKSSINRIETQLRDANQHTRAKLISRLKHKNPTHARWLNTSDLSVLVREAETLEKKEGVKPEVIATLYNVILSKSSNPLVLNTLSWLLPRYHQLVENRLNAADAKFHRYTVNQILRVAIDQSLLHRQWDVFDRLFELRPFTSYQPEKILVIAFSYLERDLPEKASRLLETLAESTTTLDEKTLNQVVNSEFMRTVSSETLIDDWFKMVADNFTVSNEWRQRLIMSIRLNDLRKAIDEGHLVEVNDKIDQMGDMIVRDVATSFILIDLLKAAIKANNAQVFAKVKDFIETRRDRHTTVLYIGISFLELNDQRWPTMLKKINHIPTDIMSQLVKRQSMLKRADVLHTLFNTMNKSGMSNLELENLLSQTVRVYYNAQDLTGLRKLYEEVKASGFYLRSDLRTSIESNLKKLEKQLADSTPSTSPENHHPKQ